MSEKHPKKHPIPTLSTPCFDLNKCPPPPDWELTCCERRQYWNLRGWVVGADQRINNRQFCENTERERGRSVFILSLSEAAIVSGRQDLSSCSTKGMPPPPPPPLQGGADKREVLLEVSGLPESPLWAVGSLHTKYLSKVLMRSFSYTLSAPCSPQPPHNFTSTPRT